jgi:hypothetical protein
MEVGEKVYWHCRGASGENLVKPALLAHTGLRQMLIVYKTGFTPRIDTEWVGPDDLSIRSESADIVDNINVSTFCSLRASRLMADSAECGGQ